MFFSTFRLILLLLCCSTATLFAQVEVGEQKAKGLIYTKEKSGNISFGTAGVSLGASFGHIKTYYHTTFWKVELGRLKHPKEYKQAAPPPNAGRAYVFGKENNFMTLRVLKGGKKYLSEKASVRGVAIGFEYQGGLSLGLLKPYYLNINRNLDPGLPDDLANAEKFSEENRDFFLSNTYITGAAPFWTGIGETKFIPGAHFKLGVLFDWGAFDEVAKSMDAGIMIDVFPKKVPIMIESQNYPLFLNLYVNLQFGKRS